MLYLSVCLWTGNLDSIIDWPVTVFADRRYRCTKQRFRLYGCPIAAWCIFLLGKCLNLKDLWIIRNPPAPSPQHQEQEEGRPDTRGFQKLLNLNLIYWYARQLKFSRFVVVHVVACRPPSPRRRSKFSFVVVFRRY